MLFPFLTMSGGGERWKDGIMERDMYSHGEGDKGWMEGNVLLGWRRQRRSVALLLGMRVSHGRGVSPVKGGREVANEYPRTINLHRRFVFDRSFCGGALIGRFFIESPITAIQIDVTK